MDGEYYLDSSGQFGVFLNGKKVSFAHLKEKDLITIGGGSGLEKLGDTLNEHFLKPCITYMFTASSFVKDKENIYTRKNDDSLITLQDIFDGHCISESFCEEDFNATMVTDYKYKFILLHYMDCLVKVNFHLFSEQNLHKYRT